tara:strand:+ start:173 stop:607 length:435 start_codon:yes stop_codon:yes gene_type:complete
MPNHCHNRVTFYSDDTTLITKLHNIFKSDNIFTQFIPEPDWANTPNEKGELPIQPEPDSMFPPQFPDGTTDDRWYSWRLANWGTKWDAYEVEIDDSEMHNGFEVTFDTAWSPPEEICHAIKEQFDNLCVSWFFDEPGMEVAGYL